MRNYHPLSAYWKEKFGTKVWKIPLDAGLTCPNRDGTISSSGCIFCNEQGSGTGLNLRSISLKDQYNLYREKLIRRHGHIKFAAYLQSFSNTYCTLEHLKLILQDLEKLDDLAVLCIGTRPDCLDKDKINSLAHFPSEEVWLDLGLQSSCDETLKRINRGHLARDFSISCRLAASRGLRVCAHVIAGLPGETLDHFLKTIDFLNHEPVQGIKIHNLYICRHTTLAAMWEKRMYTPLSMKEYAWWVCRGLAGLRPDIIIHRLTGDPAPGELKAPQWAEAKSSILNLINTTLEKKGLHQGQEWSNV